MSLRGRSYEMAAVYIWFFHKDILLRSELTVLASGVCVLDGEIGS